MSLAAVAASAAAASTTVPSFVNTSLRTDPLFRSCDAALAAAASPKGNSSLTLCFARASESLAATAFLRSSSPSPVAAETHTVSRSPVLVAASALAASLAPAPLLESAASTLFQATTVGAPSATPISRRTRATVDDCAAAAGCETSTTWTKRSAAAASSSVARNAATSCVGSFWMNPTVSVSSAALPPGKPGRRLVVGSSVANGASSASAVAPVKALSRLDLPALVYPTSATTGTRAAARAALREARSRLTASISFLRAAARARSSLLSTSICFSPMPLVRPPLCRSRWDHIRVRRGSWYSACASSTWSIPSRDAARCAKMSRISAVRSQTPTFFVETLARGPAKPPPGLPPPPAYAPSRAPSRLRACAGVSSSSKITTSARDATTAAAISATLPAFTYVLGFGAESACESLPTTTSPAVSASDASSARDSAVV